MPRRPNPTIGMVPCAHCGALAAVRKDARSRFYYLCGCGGPYFSNEYVLEHGTIWGEGNPPADLAPTWIKKGLAWPPGSRGNGERPRAPEPKTEAVPAAAAGELEGGGESAPGLSPPVPVPRREPKTDADRGGFSFGLFRRL